MAKDKPAFDPVTGQRNEDVDVKAAPTVKLENAGGKEVVVLVSDVTKRHLFAGGFKLIKGEKYPDEVKEAHDAYEKRRKAQGISDGVDTGETGQSQAHVDVERRKGTNEATPEATDDAETNETVDEPADEPEAPEAPADEPKEPKKATGRAAKALNK